MSGNGWIVGNGSGRNWRFWEDGTVYWTPDKNKATRYHRREDAEAVHAEDDAAWLVVEFEEKSP